MTESVRISVKVLLLNERNELLLMSADDPKTTSPDKKYHGKFWFCVGGRIEEGESLQEAALREIFEEAGIPREKIELGPVVWVGEFDMILDGVLTHMKQTFIVAKTTQKEVDFYKLDSWEMKCVKDLSWFSLEKIRNSSEVIYPVVLPDYLPDILLGKYPAPPLEVDLAKQPRKSSQSRL